MKKNKDYEKTDIHTGLYLLRQSDCCPALPLYSQYLYNKFLINPAHAGSDGYTSLNLTVREQWVGYAGAPRTCLLKLADKDLKK